MSSVRDSNRFVVLALILMMLVGACTKVSTQNGTVDSISNSASVASIGHLKEVYELQERCGKQSNEWFVSEYGKSGVADTKDGQSVTSYRNHYDDALNKCFVLLTTSSVPFKNKKVQPSVFISLLDLHEKREIGMYFQVQGDSLPFQCSVAGEACKTESEWKAKIAIYMGD